MSGAPTNETYDPAPSPYGKQPVNPCLFVVGAARSGTTLLQRMLDAHPQLAVVNETYLAAPEVSRADRSHRAGLATEALLPLLLERPKFSRMG